MSRIVYDGMTFDYEQIMSGEIYEAVSLLCDSLEIGTFQAEIYIRDEAIGQKLVAFRRNTPLEYYEGDRKKGIWHMDSIERTGKFTYDIKANNAVALLEQSQHMGGIYTGQTVDEVLADICTVPFVIKSNLKGVKLYGWLPVASRRSNMAQVLFAIGAVVTVDQDGVLHIEALWDGITAHISPDRIFWGDKVRYESAVTEVSVLEHQYAAGTEEVNLYEGTTQANDVILFDEPVHSLTASGITILESGANYAIVSAGNGTITGKKYVHTTRAVQKAVSDAEIANVIEVKNATLISLVNSVAVAERLANYYVNVQTMENSVVYEGESAGDVSSFEHPFGGNAHGTIKSVEITLGNGKAVATEKTLIGYRPPKMEQENIKTVVEIITEPGIWRADRDIEDLRVIVIGGGDGGAGGNGGDGSCFQYGTAILGSRLGPFDIEEGIGPSGGQPGAPGAGGKFLIETISVSEGEEFQVSIGAGGKGGAGGTGGTRSNTNNSERVKGGQGAAGESGGDTVFGNISSANGASSDAGYLELIGGEIFAALGVEGFHGGHGGGTDGGAVSGQSVGDFPGGAPGATLTDNSNYIARGGGGGGAAYGAPGNKGDDAELRSSSTSISGYDGTYRAYASGDGGNGANAIKASAGARYGCGGQGGHGGGGAGAKGDALGTGSYAVFVNIGYGEATAEGYGGSGGEGGDGMQGCVILYYGVSEEVAAGAVMDSKKRFILDKTGRLVVV